ncbi:MAG: hypothetical protein WBD04_02995, partial [Candidatus Omnitrophota bacterium]
MHLRFDPNRPFTLYFEFGSEEEYQAFRREMEKTRETGSELGIYMSRYGISFGYKKDRVDPMKHEMQHAFYDAVAMTPEKHLEQIVRKLSGKADDFSRLLSDEKYQEAEAIIHTMSEILSQEMRDEFIAYLSEGGRLSGHFVFYMKSFGQYREKGVITIMSERIDAIEDEAKKVEMRNHFEKAFGSLKDPKIRGYVCNTIIEYEEIAKDFIELAGRERCIALLHLIPLNKLYRLKYLSEYYRERYTKEIGADLDKTEALIDEYMAAQKTRKGKSSSERIREVYDEFRIRREEILSRRLTGEDVREELSELEDEKSKRVSVLLRELESDELMTLKAKVFSAAHSMLIKVGIKEKNALNWMKWQSKMLFLSGYEDFTVVFNKLFSDKVLANARLTALLVRVLTEVSGIDRGLVDTMLEARMPAFKASIPRLTYTDPVEEEKRVAMEELFHGQDLKDELTDEDLERHMRTWLADKEIERESRDPKVIGKYLLGTRLSPNVSTATERQKTEVIDRHTFVRARPQFAIKIAKHIKGNDPKQALCLLREYLVMKRLEGVHGVLHAHDIG